MIEIKIPSRIMCKDNIVRVVPIHEGMKIFMTSEESFL